MLKRHELNITKKRNRREGKITIKLRKGCRRGDGKGKRE